MPRKEFSTGLPTLDRYIGDLRPGDAVLSLLSLPEQREELLQPLLEYSSSARIPVLYLSAGEQPACDLRAAYRLECFSPSGAGLKAPRAIAGIERFVRKGGKNRYIVTDDLSLWRGFLRSEQLTVELFRLLSELATRQKSVLVSTAVKSSLGLATLGNLKDAASTCLDFLTYRGELYCFPIGSRGKYLPAGSIPFRFVRKELSKETGQTAESPASGRSDEQENRMQSLENAVAPGRQAYRELFERSGEPMVLFDPEGDFREVNGELARVSGYSEQELRTLNPLSVVSPKHRIRFGRFILELRKKRRARVTVDFIRKNGRILPAEISASGVGTGVFLGLIRDIGEQQKSERLNAESEEESRSLIEGLPHPILILQANRPVFANPAFYRLFGLAPGTDVTSLTLKDLLVPASFQHYQRIVRERGSFADPYSSELEGRRPDGSSLHCLVTCSELVFRRKRSVQLTFVDTTVEREARLRLAASESRYREIVERSPGPVSMIQDGAYLYVNQAFLELFGYESAEEIVGREYAVVQEEPGTDWFKEAGSRREAQKDRFPSTRYRGVRKDGSRIEIEVGIFPVKNIKGVYLAYHRDITREQQSEREVARRREEMRLLREIVSLGTGAADIQKMLRSSLSNIMDVLGWEMGALYLSSGAGGGTLEMSVHRALPAALVKNMQALESDTGLGGFMSKTQEPHLFQMKKFPSYLPFRSLIKESGVTALCLIPLLSREHLVGIVLLCSKREQQEDRFSAELLSAIGHQLGITVERSMMYREIKEREESYAALIASIPDVLYAGSLDGIMQYISPSVQGFLGYAQREFYQNKFLWLSLVHPDDKKFLLELKSRRPAPGERIVREYRVRPKGKASFRWVRDVVHVEREDGGSSDRVSGIISDITEFKDLAERINGEVTQREQILAGIREGICVYDRHLRCVRWNQTMVDITGLKEEEALGSRASESLPGYGDRDLAEMLPRVLEGQTVSSEELSFEITATGKKGLVRADFSPLRDATGAITGFLGVLADVTARKKLETGLRESERILRNIIDTMADLLIITDLEGTLLQVNKSFVQLLGYSRTESIGLPFPYPWLIEEEMGRYVTWISTLRERNWLHDFDMTWKGKTGQAIAVSVSTTLLRDSMGEPIAMLNIARDITERARLAKDLEQRNKQIEMINRVIGLANQTMDFDLIFSAIAREINGIVAADMINIGLLGKGGDTLTVYASAGTKPMIKGSVIPLERSVTRIALRENRPVVVDDFSAEPKYREMISVSKGMRSQIALPIRLKGLFLGALNIGSVEAYAFSADHVRILEPLAQELGSIIDRVDLFKQVTEDAAYIHTLLDSIDSVVYTVDRECRVREGNKAWRDFLEECGVKLEGDGDGRNLFDVLPDESLKEKIRTVVDQLLNGEISMFSEEHTHRFPSRERVYQLTINPMVIETQITGLVFVHVDITDVKKTEEKLKRNNEQLLALNEISTLASTALRLEEILEAAVPLVKRVMTADAAAVYLLGPEGTDLVLLKQTGITGLDTSGMTHLNSSNSITGDVVESNRAAYITSEAHLDERVNTKNRKLLESAGLESMAVIPLASKEKALGALDLFYTQAREFSLEERRLLALVGNQLGSAIENARLYTELRAQIEQLISLYELSQELTSTLDIDRIFQVVCDNVQWIVPYAEFSIDLYDSSTRTRKPAFHIRVVDGERIVTPRLQQPAPIEPDTPEWAVFSTKQSFRDPGGRSMCVPMLSKDEIMGIMSISSGISGGTSGGTSGRYTPAQTQALESVANLTAIALEKGQLYEETIRISNEIRQRNKELDDFTYVVSHDLKEPLISVEGFSRILQSDYAGVIEAEGREFLDSIVSASTRMKGLIDDLLMLSRMSRPMEAFKMVALKPIIEEIKSDMEFTIRQKKVRMVVPDDLPGVYGNETQLKALFRNLIGNAIKFNDKPDPVVEIAFHNAENNSYLFSVRDNGIGIEPEFFEKIFVIFQRLHRREQYEGSGAGLAIVKKIIERHRGRIWVESEMGKGSTFFLTLPATEIEGT